MRLFLLVSVICVFVNLSRGLPSPQQFNSQFPQFNQYDDSIPQFRPFPTQDFGGNLPATFPVQNQNSIQLDSDDLPFRLRTQLQKQQTPTPTEILATKSPSTPVNIYDFAAYMRTGEPLSTLPPLHIPSPIPPGAATATPPTFTTPRSSIFRNLFGPTPEPRPGGGLTGILNGFVNFLNNLNSNLGVRN